jgi:hypothetical protein
MRAGIAFSIMGLLPSIASTLAYSLPAGPAGLVWVSKLLISRWDRYTDDRKGWFVASGFIFIVGLAMADMVNSCPYPMSTSCVNHLFRAPPCQHLEDCTIGHIILRRRALETRYVSWSATATHLV